MYEFNHRDDFEHLIGGRTLKQAVGNSYKALISHGLGKDLIFAIIELVNLNTPDINGKGTTYIYSPWEDDDEDINGEIIKRYDAIIDEIKAKHIPVSAFEKWYNLNTFIHIGINEDPKITATKDSQWRRDGFLQKQDKPKKNYGYLKKNNEGNDYTEDFVESHAKNYLSEYVQILKDKLEFDKFPHYAVLVRPIAVRDKGETIPLGNIYLHFATDKRKEEDDYLRLINDILLIWSREQGKTIYDKFREDAQKEAEEIVFYTLKEGYPAIWTDYCPLQFNSEEIEKIDKPFMKTEKNLSDFFECIFKTDVYKSLISRNQEYIKEHFLKAFLKHRGWLKSGVHVDDTFSIMKNLDLKIQHNKVTDFSPTSIKYFLHIFYGRDIINVCSCLFGMSIPYIHGLFISKSFNSESTATVRTLSTYFTPYFMYCPKGYQPNSLSPEVIFKSASKKEKEFLEECAAKINMLIKDDCRDEFNKLCYSELALHGMPEIKIKKNRVKPYDVKSFKENWCNENKIIPQIFKDAASEFFVQPILDCGTGLADIPLAAFPDKEAILIDVNALDEETILSPKHTYKQTSFFDYYPEKPIKTLLVSHTLQFIDDDIERLNRKVAELNPEHLILVLNRNDDVLNDLLEWTNQHYENANPEIRPEKFKEKFPNGYKLIKEINFEAEVDCKDNFDKLAEQISYLMLFDLSETGDQLKEFLIKRLDNTSKFTFGQVVEIYKKEKEPS
jgi:hypothetical protein